MRFFKKIKHIISWIKYIVKDENYDWYYMFIIERKKLVDTINFFEENKSFYSVTREIERMKTCVNLLNIILGYTNISEKYINTRNSELYKEYVQSNLLDNVSIDTISNEVYIDKAKKYILI